MTKLHVHQMLHQRISLCTCTLHKCTDHHSFKFSCSIFISWISHSVHPSLGHLLSGVTDRRGATVRVTHRLRGKLSPRGPAGTLWKLKTAFTNEFTILTDYHHRGPVKTQYCTHKKVYKFYSFIWQKVVLDMIVIYNRKSNFTQFACLQNFYVLKTVNTVRFFIEGIIYLQLLINIIEGFFVTKLYPFFSFLPLFVSSSKFQL